GVSSARHGSKSTMPSADRRWPTTALDRFFAGGWLRPLWASSSLELQLQRFSCGRVVVRLRRVHRVRYSSSLESRLQMRSDQHPVGATGSFPPPTRTDVALSPDGTLLVFSGRT